MPHDERSSVVSDRFGAGMRMPASDGGTTCAGGRKSSRLYGKTERGSADPFMTQAFPHGGTGAAPNARQTNLFCCRDMNPSNARLPVHTTPMAPAMIKANRFWLKSGTVSLVGVSRGTKCVAAMAV